VKFGGNLLFLPMDYGPGSPPVFANCMIQAGEKQAEFVLSKCPLGAIEPQKKKSGLVFLHHLALTLTLIFLRR
jgi:hypothetical protein